MKLTPPCQDAPLDLFFPDSKRDSDYDKARAICAQCPAELKDRCLRLAMANERALCTRFGVFGGLTPRERHELATATAKAGGELTTCLGVYV